MYLLDECTLRNAYRSLRFPISHLQLQTTEFLGYLLKESGVVSIPGSFFREFMREYIRISFADSSECEKTSEAH